MDQATTVRIASESFLDGAREANKQINKILRAVLQEKASQAGIPITACEINAAELVESLQEIGDMIVEEYSKSMAEAVKQYL